MNFVESEQEEWASKSDYYVKCVFVKNENSQNGQSPTKLLSIHKVTTLGHATQIFFIPCVALLLP